MAPLRLLLACCFVGAGVLDAPAVEPKPLALFDGATLFGWTATSNANWTVADDAIIVSNGEPGFLMTNSQFADFELQLEFQADETTNSGVFVRSARTPQDPTSDCLEINIADATNPFPTGSIVARSKVPSPLPYREGWRKMTLRAEGRHIQITIDDMLVNEFEDASPAVGHVGLQFNQGAVRFRNIRLIPLALASIFNGHDLDGWRTHPDLGGEFFVVDGQLRVRGGPGQLETKSEYANFLLQLECITHAAELNSGVFFRCIPRDRMMGYESQIHNGFADDRSQPTDFGTGGIFRRQTARRVVANDQEWFHKTIVASDNHLAVWVNGEQVSDWTDHRAGHENPRKGSRLAAGTIMLQAHDPTTDLSFRNIRIAEYLIEKRGGEAGEAPAEPR